MSFTGCAFSSRIGEIQTPAKVVLNSLETREVSWKGIKTVVQSNDSSHPLKPVDGHVISVMSVSDASTSEDVLG